MNIPVRIAQLALARGGDGVAGADEPAAAQPGEHKWTTSSAVAWLVRVVVVLGAVANGVVGALSLVAPRTFLGAVGHPDEPLSAGVQVFAAYTGTRDLAVALLLLVLLAARSTRPLAGVVLLVALTNTLDGLDALASQRWAQLPGALVFAAVFAAVAIWLLRRPGPTAAT
jgi:hypothetical protein